MLYVAVASALLVACGGTPSQEANAPFATEPPCEYGADCWSPAPTPADDSADTYHDSSEDSSSTSSSSSGGEIHDASANLACTHRRNIMRDVSDGVLTENETREKLKKVANTGSVASPAIASASRRMLAALTQNDEYAMRIALQDMDAACDAAGY